MEFSENCLVAQVRNDSDAVRFTCLKKEEEKVYEVKWNKGEFDPASREIIPNKEKKEVVNQWCQKYFDLDLANIEDAEGKLIDVYSYDTFASFWECDAKFDKEDVGQEFETEIAEIDATSTAIVVKYFWKGEKYHTNFRFTTRVGKEYFVNPQKKRKQLERFEDMFGLPIERKDELIGLPIKVKIKLAMGQFPHGEIKIDTED